MRNILKSDLLIKSTASLALCVGLSACVTSDETRYVHSDPYTSQNTTDTVYSSSQVYIDDRRQGIDQARYLHQVRSDSYAENFDGDCEQYITVRRGDTLSDIAEYCDTPLRALMAVNELSSPHLLEVGQRLRIPYANGSVYDGISFGRVTTNYNRNNPDTSVVQQKSDKTADYPIEDTHYEDEELADDNFISYRLRRGESLEDVSRRFNIDKKTILAYNRYLLQRDARSGDDINLPVNVLYKKNDTSTDRVTVESPTEYQRTSYRPAIQVKDVRIRYGEPFQVSISNMPPDTEVVLALGQHPDRMRDYHRARTDSYGRYEHDITFNDRNYVHDTVVLSVRTNDSLYAVSTDPIRYERTYSQFNAQEVR